MKKQFISWRRVSTFRQSKSGLGLEAQKEIIRYFVERDGGELIADFSECYTGKELSGCKELRKAMKYAKEKGAILVIAKSDRFRNCQEALGILDEMGEGHLEFCDLPHSDRFTLTLFWALAEREALITSIRTKQALAVKKAQGARLGASNEKYRLNYEMKSETIKREEGMKKGIIRNRHKYEGRETQTMIRILRRVFPDYTKGEPNKWRWTMIGTRDGACDAIYNAMEDYKAMDDTGTLFSGWDFAAQIDKRKRQQKLAAYMQAIKKTSDFYFNNLNTED